MPVFWVVAPYGLVGTEKRFSGAYCLHYQGDDLHARRCENVKSHTTYDA
jgi:hypothetical protein